MISAEEKTHRRNVAIISLVPASSPLWKLLKRIKMQGTLILGLDPKQWPISVGERKMLGVVVDLGWVTRDEGRLGIRLSLTEEVEGMEW